MLPKIYNLSGKSFRRRGKKVGNYREKMVLPWLIAACASEWEKVARNHREISAKIARKLPK
jgi:hypothetical protein